MCRTGLRLLTAVLIASFVGATSVGAYAEALAQQTSGERGVTVRVTPRELSPTAKAWEFEIVLESHTQDLADDLTAISELVADTGAKQAPFAWEGDPPGGHHRKGVLRFAPVMPQPKTIDLRILRAGETSPRSFRWQMK